MDTVCFALFDKGDGCLWDGRGYGVLVESIDLTRLELGHWFWAWAVCL
jgi:hypothetical protein